MMKKYSLPNLSFIVAVIIISCSNSNSSNTASAETQLVSNTIKNTYLGATINGKAWQANHDIQSPTMENKIILGGEDDEWALNINIPADAVTGQTITTDDASAVKKDKAGNIAYTESKDATVKITARSIAYIEGSFSFTATNINGKGTVKVVNGKFKTKLIVR
jgi:Family of unknown function (DUF6252)